MKKRDLIIRILIFIKIIYLLFAMLNWGLLYKYEVNPAILYRSDALEIASLREGCLIADKFIINFIGIELIWAVIFFVLMCFKNKSKKTESTSKIKGEEIKSLQ